MSSRLSAEIRPTALSAAKDTLGTVKPVTVIDSFPALISAALQLGADQVGGWSQAEKALAKRAAAHQMSLVELRDAIQAGQDPLGDAFSLLRSAEQRRPLGQTYTPAPIVASMVNWASAQATPPSRVIDPGAGSARYLLAAGRRWKTAQLVGTDVDPVAGLIARANLATAGFAGRSHVTLTDYRNLQPEPIDGRTLYLGNPPYVRHHLIDAEWKRWLVATAGTLGLEASQLAGLHVYFFLATAAHGQQGDYGTFITSAEWLDVNYGRLVRELLTGPLGGTSLHVLEPDALPFADATTTGAITCFELGSTRTSMRVRRVQKVRDLGKLDGGRKVALPRLVEATRWGPLTRVTPKLPSGYVELGELCRVHRGSVTGANRIWVTREGTTDLPDSVLYRSITRARELFDAGDRLASGDQLKLVVDLPADLDVFDPDERKAVDKFLRIARQAGGADGYVARNRKAWWRVGLREPAPLLATYMARRTPAFVLNEASARHINIAHGIYPRQPMTAGALAKLADHLRVSVNLGQGRTYAGGLVKFEPKEMERLPVPAPELLLTQ